MKIFTSKKQKIGLIGEELAEMFLVKQGFSIIDCNFSCRFGEIDIVGIKDLRIYFFEVKTLTVSCETEEKSKYSNNSAVSREISSNLGNNSVSRGTITNSFKKLVSPACPVGRRETFIQENRKLVNPFQNISKSKMRRFLKTIDIYLAKNHVPRETRWQADGIGVFLDESHKLLKIDHISNINIF